jgi:hypothetical protein
MNVRLDCLLREGIDLIKWSKSESSQQELKKDKTELVDEGFHGEFVPVKAKSRDRSSSHTKENRESNSRNKSIGKYINFISLNVRLARMLILEFYNFI